MPKGHGLRRRKALGEISYKFGETCPGNLLCSSFAAIFAVEHDYFFVMLMGQEIGKASQKGYHTIKPIGIFENELFSVLNLDETCNTARFIPFIMVSFNDEYFI